MCSKQPEKDENPEDQADEAVEKIGPFPVWPDEPGGLISGNPDKIIERIRRQRDELGDRDLDDVDDDDLYDNEDEDEDEDDQQKK